VLQIRGPLVTKNKIIAALTENIFIYVAIN